MKHRSYLRTALNVSIQDESSDFFMEMIQAKVNNVVLAYVPELKIIKLSRSQ